MTPADVARVVETAKAINIPTDQRLLLVEPQEFVIDGQEVKEPIGMSGMPPRGQGAHRHRRAERGREHRQVRAPLRPGGRAADAATRCASSRAVLTDDEKDLGVALVDIGAGTTDVAIFTDGAIRHTAVIPIAGDLITSDIAMALRTPTKDAEEIKVEYGVRQAAAGRPERAGRGAGPRRPRRRACCRARRWPA